MINVLIIVLEFAPVQTTGAFRSIALVKYLENHGLRPIVISIEPDEASTIFGAKKNKSLQTGLPEGLEIHHIRSSYPIKKEGKISEYFRILTKLDDNFFQRFQKSLDETIKTIRKNTKIEAVYASLPPFGSAQLAEMAANRLNVPLILDFRDAWSEWELGSHPTYFHYQRKKKDEARAFSAASSIIATTDQMRNLFISTHPEVPNNKFKVVFNGFDGSPFKHSKIRINNDEYFNIAYVGSYYYTPKTHQSFIDKLKAPHRFIQYNRGKEDWSYRSPLYFFQTWQQLFNENPTIASRLRFHHIGTVPQWLRDMVTDHKLDNYCKFWGTVPQQELQEILNPMNALLITSMKRIDGEDYFLASKTFEYLLAQKPILGFVTNGAQREFLIKSGVALICDPDDLSTSSQLIQDLVNGDISFSLNQNFVNQFTRTEMTRKISNIIKETIKNTKVISL